jgi:hypothetical protein
MYPAHRLQRSLELSADPCIQRRDASEVNAALKLTIDPSLAQPSAYIQQPEEQKLQWIPAIAHYLSPGRFQC